MTAKALTAADALVRNRIEAIYASELKNAYAAAGRPLSDDTIASVAASLAAAIPADPDEIRPMFREARSRADIPTQRLLIDSLAAIPVRRETHGNAAPKVSVTIGADGKIEIETAADVSVKAGTLELTGDLSVTGKIAADGEVTANAKTMPVNLSTHIHASAAGPTGAPTPNT